MSKKQAVVSFLKRNAFYLILAVVLTVIAIVGAVVLLNQNNSAPTFKKTSSSVSSSSINSGITSNSGSTSNSTGNSSSSSQNPVPTIITFTMPVENGIISKEYTDNTVVFNPTLGVYSAHLAIDITGAEGASVLCAYSGVVESIDTSYLQGTVVTINHGDGLKTVYSSLEVDENLYVGQTLNAGDEIGVISTTNRQEYKEGAHLHFETIKNDVKVDPTDYLVIEEDK